MANVYTHDQLVGSSTWTVTHNLDNLLVTLDVVIDFSGRQKVLPLNTKVIDSNTVEVEFSTPHTGSARVIVRD